MTEPQTIIVHGPQGCGKSRNAQGLQHRFGCTSITDGWDGRKSLQPGTLALTNCEPPFKSDKGALVLSFEAAMKGQA